jgi:hypothetical protein
MAHGPFDLRAEIYRDVFNKAPNFSSYVATGTPQQQERWNSMYGSLTLSDTQRGECSSWTRTLNLLVMSGVWCGDCIRQCPMIARIAEAAPAITLRFIDNNQHAELRDQLRIAGGARVPVLIALSEDFFEIGRFGDRTLSHYRAKAKRELGVACDAGLYHDHDELSRELSEWLEVIERFHLMVRLSPFLRERHGD